MNILLAVTSSISAYKACDLINLLRKNDCNVKVMMSENAKYMIGECTLAALSGEGVITNTFDDSNGEISHIQYAQEWAHKMVIAPATANIIGKMANGIADDLISTTYMAMKKRFVIVCPAMNTVMYYAPANKRNIDRLIEDGIVIIRPVEGRLACGDIGRGKLAPVDVIVSEIMKNEDEFYE
jgi:phosphopantothenoylcysteine decarboxylase/phosphopantothenate--cysteine ligase